MKYYNIYNSFKSINNNKSSAILHKFSTFSRFYAKQLVEKCKTAACLVDVEVEEQKLARLDENGSHFRIMSVRSTEWQLNEKNETPHKFSWLFLFISIANPSNISVLFPHFPIEKLYYIKRIWNYFWLSIELFDSVMGSAPVNYYCFCLWDKLVE